MKIINIVDSLKPVNYGIWNAAIFTAPVLKKKYGIESEIWFPACDNQSSDLEDCTPIPLSNLSTHEVNNLIQQRNLQPSDTIIVTHGVWRFSTRWGLKFKKLGFKWIYVPHPMLERWSRQRKWRKKLIYFNLFEKNYAQKADIVRAVSSLEMNNLRQYFKPLVHIPNGILPIDYIIDSQKYTGTKIVLFMARLHHKKAVIPLVKAWLKSKLLNNSNFQLLIAGPDDGELATLTDILKNEGQNSNIQYIGAIYGQEKIEILSKSSFYILPTQSEGFPTSVLEATQFGLIPLISDGCNFPEIFAQKLAFRISPNEGDIVQTLNFLPDFSESYLFELGKRNREFALQNYSIEVIAKQQVDIFQKLK